MNRREAIVRLKGWLITIKMPTKEQLGYIEKWVTKEDIEALHIAISSLETDEAYQLEYESVSELERLKEIMRNNQNILTYISDVELPSVYPKSDKSCADCMWQVCNYNKMIDYNKLLKEVSDKIEDYVCNHVKDHAKAQGMCDALTMIEDYIKENVNGKVD